nr:hydroxymethylglutaryl-CoA lyase [Desulfuromonadales bacterium]
MADTDELVQRLVAGKDSGVVISGLALNERGVERGLECGVEMFCLGASASETHSVKNTGMSLRDAVRRIIVMAERLVEQGKKVQVSVQSAFGCGYQGPISEQRVLNIVSAYVGAGLNNISLADTAGHGNPQQVERLFSVILDRYPDVQCTGHFHNTYGLGMANVMAALKAGVTSIETSFAGLGGCPFTRVAAGNVPTEDFVHTLQRQGMREDVDLDQLIGVAGEVAEFFDREMPGCVYKTGAIPDQEAA